ncbi:MAG TPA: DUF1292 domain-containing protein [Bacilli bacterium]
MGEHRHDDGSGHNHQHNHQHSHHHHDHDCDCDHDHDEEPVFVLTDEDGNEREMILVYTFELDERMYAVLLDKYDMEADGMIFRVEDDGEEAALVNIDDDDEWERVVKVYEEISQSE